MNLQSPSLPLKQLGYGSFGANRLVTYQWVQ